VTTVEQVETGAAIALQDQVATKRRRRPVFRGTWWRHVVAVIAVLWAIFPIV
jgi:hypothetical protein